jgi:Na+/melibiose symporter-like transporter
MDSTRKTGIIVGVLFLVATAANMLGEGLMEPILNAPGYLTNVSENGTQVIIGVLLQLITGAAVVGIGVLMFPGAAFEILLPVWLIVKGFNPSAIASGSVKADINDKIK